MSAEARSATVLVFKPRLRRLARVALWSIGPPLALGLLSVGTMRPVFHGVAALFFLVFVGLRLMSRSVHRGALVASPQGLEVDGRLVLAADGLSSGGYGRSGRAHCLTLFSGDRPCAQVFVNRAVADRLMAQLQHGMPPAAVDFIGLSRAAVSPARLAAIVIYCLSVVAFFIVVVDGSGGDLPSAAVYILVGISPAAVLVMTRSRIRVGADGVSIRWLLRERFVPYRELDEVEDIQHGVVLHHRGRRVRVIITDSEATDQLNRGDALRRAIQHAFAKHQRAGGGELTSLLERGDRETDVWMAELDALGTTEGYRQVSMTPDALWSILEDPAVEITARAGAAFLLAGRELGPEGRIRVGKSADAAAAANLREVLQTVAAAGELAPVMERMA